jgi:hypothetical protein
MTFVKGQVQDLLLHYDGGPRGIRTLDLLNAIETRSQLRYGPKTILDFLTHVLAYGASASDLRFGFRLCNRHS